MSFRKVIVAFAAAAAICVIAHPADAARKKVRHRAAAPAASSAAVTDAMHDARHERGYVCYTDHFHYGSSLGQSSRRAAEIAAIGSWESFVDFEYGSSWARFGKAGSKSMKCDQSGAGWGCSVEARPCR